MKTKQPKPIHIDSYRLARALISAMNGVKEGLANKPKHTPADKRKLTELKQLELIISK